MFRKFPYSDFSNLNIDWILDIVQRAEETLNNLNDTISVYVRRMTLTLQGDIAAGKQESMNYARQMESQYDSKLKALQQWNNKILTQLQTQMMNLSADVDAKNKNNYNNIIYQVQIYTNNVNQEILKLRTQLRYTESSINEDMKILRNWVESEIAALQNLMQSTWSAFIQKDAEEKANLHDSIAQVYIDLNNEFESVYKALSQYNELNIQQLNIVQAQFMNEISKKADTVTVNDALQELEEKINGIDVNTSTVYNPVTMTITNIDTALTDIYNAHENVWALTAGEYDELQITAAEYDKYKITAWEYDNLVRWFLWYKPKLIHHFHRDLRRLRQELIDRIDNIMNGIGSNFDLINTQIQAANIAIQKLSQELEFNTHMYSPISGKYVTVTNAVLELASEIQKVNGITAASYDTLQITATSYDAKRITAYQYDWNGKQILGGI